MNWHDIQPDPRIATPLYVQMATRLADAIRRGAWRSGDALPSERLLAEALNVSRVTSRKAMSLLAQQGLIRRTQGAGTFVRSPDDGVARVAGLTMLTRGPSGLRSTREVSRTIRAASTDELFQFGVSPGAEVVQVERVRIAGATVIGVERTTRPLGIEPDSPDSPHATLSYGGAPVVRALEHFRAVAAPPTVAVQLDVATGTALLQITRTGYSASQCAVEVTQMYYRSECYDLVAEWRGQPVTHET
ncbi:GntR family transcriptional regulator [Paraburkholderia sp.]|uniref:GntR family transcriptional regulator n=1 Tax=Paraburkholderia sp. TaxID=1926495 RepID=UPI0023A3AF6E|nr:GntR family transcriptional regulator [Paraburkholderia sp.]MDE1179337.1 GntR family transcriptional regulator [Paraburkholderia sp.]